MAKPKLALIPAAQGTSLYSVLPSSGVGDFNFTRSGSATRINSQGLIETVSSGVSRLNYPMIDGVVKGCPHHILEPQRTNLIQYSEDFTQWNNTGVNVTLNQGISPNGNNNANRIEGTLSSQSFSITTSSVSNYTFSIYVKPINSPFIRIIGGINKCYFDMTNKTVATNTFDEASIEDVGNGWFRLVGSSSNTTTTFETYAHLVDNTSTEFVGSDYLVWGAQVESGSYATSYIPNYGTSGGVTRSAETATGSGDAATFNDSEGVLMAEISALTDSESGKYLAISNVGNYQIRIGFLNGALYVQMRINGSVPYAYSELATLTNTNKIAISWTKNTQKVYVNGSLVNSGTNSTIIPTGTLTSLSFNNGDVSGGSFYGNTKDLRVYNTELTDAELQALTT